MSSVEKYLLKDGSTKYKVRYRDDTGSQRQKKGFRTKRDANLYAATVETTKAAGLWVDPSAGKITVGVLYGQYTQGLSHLKKTTQATREVTWKTHVEPRWADKEVGSVKPSQVRSWVTELQANGAKVATIENAIGVLRGVLAVAVEDRLLPTNPAAGVKTPRRSPRAHRFLTHQQVQQLADECGSDGLVVLVLAYTGLRVGELAALRVADVDFLRKRLAVTQSVSEVRGHGLVWSATKTYESRSVPLPQFLVEPLSRQAARKDRDALLFAGDQGEPFRVNNWRRRVYRPAVNRCRKVDPGFPELTVHDLRGTAASLAVSAGANVKAVQTLLGHASAAVTLDVYASLFPDDLEAVADALDRQRATHLSPVVLGR
ncbi:site-specific integrase [Williamsia muralis]|uniref:site-specific integrase n=1 Tax=Williamsia marianensis TaxID=85044 RepID=UPI000DE78FF2|nr:site-specific integrase [Williamsia marianensis]PVY29911.1 site-specific recombinase XerD [Williamsia marianensis]